MTSRLSELDHEYWRRMALSVPIASAFVVAVFIIVPGVEVPDHPTTVGFSGPLRVLPQVDILPESPEESHLTAAPAASPTDFVAVELDYAEQEMAPRIPEPSPPKLEEEEENPLDFSDWDDLQDAIRTTGHPVLAYTEYELVYMQRPNYPRNAVLLGIEGMVEIMLLVDTRGHVAQAYVVDPNRFPILEEAAMEAVHHSLFKPYIVDSRLTPFWIRIPIEFRLIN